MLFASTCPNGHDFCIDNGNFVYIVGIWAGMQTVRYFDGKTYEWVGISRQPNILGKVCLVFLHLIINLKSKCQSLARSLSLCIITENIL